MSFAAPLWLAVAGVAALGVVLAHLFSSSTPPSQVLPTARFVPEAAPMSVLRTTRLTDLGLLALRVLAVLLLGLAFAGAHVPVSGPARVVLVDVSRAVGTAHADDADNPDGTDRIIVFDSVPRAVERAVVDTLKPSTARGSLSGALVAAHREIAGITAGRNEIELVIVSPLVREEVDSATAQLIALWEGPVRLRRVASATPPAQNAFEVRASGDDPVAASLSSTPPGPGPSRVRLVRGALTSADSMWAVQGNVLVHWPVSAASGSSASSASSAWAVATSHHTVVGGLAPQRERAAGVAIARWANGEPAATEMPHGAGCIRDVAISVDPIGDVALRESFLGLARAMLEPCGGARDFTAVPEAKLLPAVRARQASIVPGTGSRLPLALAMLALIAVGIEQALRGRTRAS